MRLAPAASLLAAITALSGCAGIKELPVQEPISGVYIFDTNNLFGQGKGTIALTFDENGSELDGGVRIMGLHPATFHRRKNLHTITVWQGSHIEGHVVLDAPYGRTTFKGDLVGEDFNFTLTTSLGTLTGSAARIGPYRRPSRISWNSVARGKVAGSSDPAMLFGETDFTITASNVRNDGMGGLEFDAACSGVAPGYPMHNGQGEDLGNRVWLQWSGHYLFDNYTNRFDLSPDRWGQTDAEATQLDGTMTITSDADPPLNIETSAILEQP